MGRSSFIRMVWLLLLTPAACGWPWPYDDPGDPFRCDPACDNSAGSVCREGECVAQSTLCGDGTLHSWEQCDGALLGGKTCKGQGFDSGTLACKADCILDTTACARCGNGKLEQGEACDGALLGNKTCKGQGFDSGTLTCKTDCTLETTQCFKCGNGKLEQGEQCDGQALGNKTCKDLGYLGGSLACAKDCKYEPQDCTWIFVAGGPGIKAGGTINDEDEAQDLALDSAGNVYVAGNFNGKVTFGSKTLTSLGFREIFAAKLDALGRPVWVNSSGGIAADATFSVAADGSGGMLLAGGYQGTAYFGNTARGSKGGEGFVTRLDSSGGTSWFVATKASAATGSYYNVAMAVARDKLGVAFTGRFEATILLGSFKLSSQSMTLTDRDMFIAGVDAKGGVTWANKANGPGEVRSIAVARHNGSTYVAGLFQQKASFGTIELTSSGAEDAFVARLDSAGKYLWARRMGGAAKASGLMDTALGLTVDQSGAAYVTGAFRETGTFGTFSLLAMGKVDVFVAKLDAKGEVSWAVSGGSNGIDQGTGVALDSAGNVHVSGNIGGLATLGAAKIGKLGIGSDCFVARLDPTGKFVWARSFGGTGIEDLAEGIAVDSRGNVHVAGSLSGPATIDGKKVTPLGNRDIYVWKMGKAGP